jgi:hypothetical protein
VIGLTLEGANRLLWQIVPTISEIRLLGTASGFEEIAVVGYGAKPLRVDGWWIKDGAAAHREVDWRLVGDTGDIHGWFMLDASSVPIALERFLDPRSKEPAPIRLKSGGRFRIIPSLTLRAQPN